MAIEPGPLLDTTDGSAVLLQVLRRTSPHRSLLSIRSWQTSSSTPPTSTGADFTCHHLTRLKRHVGLGARTVRAPSGRLWLPPQWARGRLGRLQMRAAALQAARDLEELQRVQAFHRAQELHRPQALRPAASPSTDRAAPLHRPSPFRGTAGLWQH